MTTTTSHYSWQMPDPGGSPNTWGNILNGTTQAIDTQLQANVLIAASTTTPLVDGTAAVGTGTTWARADHVHPTDTTLLPRAGVTDGSNAATGQIGETIYLSGSVAVGTGVAANAVTLTLTPGDWDLYGEVQFALSATATQLITGISNVSVSAPAGPALNTSRLLLNGAGIGNTQMSPRACRVSTSAPVTYYLAVFGVFTGTCTVFGSLWARRAR